MSRASIGHAAMRALVVAIAALAGGCGPSPELGLTIRMPADRHLLASVVRLDLIATRDDRVLAQASFAGDAAYVSVAGVSHGPRTVITLDGISTAGDVVASGRTCAVEFDKGGMNAPLYFAPVNFFAPTLGPPAAARLDPVVLPMSDGAVLVAGGADASGALDNAELFSPGNASFAPSPLRLNVARRSAEAVIVPNVGALITGGLDAADRPVSDAEIYDNGLGQFVTLPNILFDARVGHRAVLLGDGRTVLVSGGRSPSANAIASTVYVEVKAGGVAAVRPGPAMTTPRYQHAAVVAVGATLVFGGYAADGVPLSTIEALPPRSMADPVPAFSPIASLQFARAEATASLLGDGSILVVGGAGDAARTPRADAELYNPVTRTTTVLTLASARRAHTATVLPDGRVLIAGGIGSDGQPLRTVELFSVGVNFVTERPLVTARAGHVAVPLCDGTVLVVGGAAEAELYTPPAS